MESILQTMLDADENITARAVAREHSGLKHASSITRDAKRRAVLAKYQEEQDRLRSWRDRLRKSSSSAIASRLAEKDKRIAKLESECEILRTSHLAMIRGVGELGGMKLWVELFVRSEAIKKTLVELRAVSSANILEIPQEERTE